MHTSPARSIPSFVNAILSCFLALLIWFAPASSVFALELPASVNGAEVEVEPSLLGQNLDTDDISAEKISQFVQAYLQVLALIEQRENELQGAELESESQQIQQEIEAEAVDLIQSTGLTLQEYLQILSLTNIDPEFGERVAAQLQEATN
jgi:hypothetical protein